MSEPRGSREPPPTELLPHHPQRLHQSVAAVQQEQLLSLLPGEVTEKPKWLNFNCDAEPLSVNIVIIIFIFNTESVHSRSVYSIAVFVNYNLQ